MSPHRLLRSAEAPLHFLALFPAGLADVLRFLPVFHLRFFSFSRRVTEMNTEILLDSRENMCGYERVTGTATSIVAQEYHLTLPE